MIKVKSIRKAAGGRPRLFTDDQVVDAAVRLGLENFTMKRVAEELGVSIATLYQYVTDRDDLLRRAIARQMASLPLPVDSGQHWSIFVREYAEGVCKMLADNPPLLIRLVHTGSNMEGGVQLAETFLAFMGSRGFSSEEAMRIMQRATVAAFGAAVIICRDRNRVERSGSLQRATRDALASFAPEEMPLLRQVEGVFAISGEDMGFELLEMLIENVALGRKEKLPNK